MTDKKNVERGLDHLTYDYDTKFVMNRISGKYYYDPLDSARINTRELLRIEKDFPPRIRYLEESVELLLGLRKGNREDLNENVKDPYFLDEVGKVLAEVYFKKITKATGIIFRHVRVKKVFSKLYKVQVEIEASTLSHQWKDILIKLAEIKKFSIARAEVNLVPKDLHWIPVRD